MPNTMFFGLSVMKMYLYADIHQIFIMNTDNTADPHATPTINSNQYHLQLEQLYMWTDGCISNTS